MSAARWVISWDAAMYSSRPSPCMALRAALYGALLLISLRRMLVKRMGDNTWILRIRHFRPG